MTETHVTVDLDPIPPAFRRLRDAFRDGTTVPIAVSFEDRPGVFQAEASVMTFVHALDEAGCDVVDIQLHIADGATLIVEGFC